jgi:hypothetical protein
MEIFTFGVARMISALKGSCMSCKDQKEITLTLSSKSRKKEKKRKRLRK